MNDGEMRRREVLCVYGAASCEAAKKEFFTWLAEDAARKLLVFDEWTPLQNVAWDHLLFELHLAFLPSATQEQRELGEKLFEKLRFLQMGAEALLSDVRDQGKRVTENILRNLPLLNGAYRASSLEGSFEGVPAVICGAGPSLHRHLPRLEEVKKKGLLVAGGSAIPLLHSQGIIPHAMAYLDPHPLEQILSKEAFSMAPLFFPLRISPEVLRVAGGPKIWAADGLSYPIETWLTSQLGVEEKGIEGGWNVVTFCISLCATMGCNPIVLVGVDLSLPEGKSYTEGMDRAYPKEMWIETQHGITKKDFLLAADWMAAFVKKHPERSLINVAQEAWKVPGIETKSLDELLQSFSSHQPVLHFSEPIQCHFEVAVKEWEENKMKAKKLLQSLLSLLESHFPSDPRGFGSYAFDEVEFEELPIFQWFLQPIWGVWRNLFEQQEGIQEPYPGFGATLQKWLFFQEILHESV